MSLKGFGGSLSLRAYEQMDVVSRIIADCWACSDSIPIVRRIS